MAEGGISPNYFYEATVTLMSKTDTISQKKKITVQYHLRT